MITVSITGERGTGKTTVAETLKNALESADQQRKVVILDDFGNQTHAGLAHDVAERLGKHDVLVLVGEGQPEDPPLTGLQPHQARVVKELDELAERLGKLSDFTNSDQFEGLSLVEQHLLIEQSFAMVEYQKALMARVSLFTQHSKHE